VWDDVQVERDVVLDECIVTDRVVVPAGAIHRRAILMRGEEGQLLVTELHLESREP
jgi:ADP-glucose pyrophosphorylase